MSEHESNSQDETKLGGLSPEGLLEGALNPSESAGPETVGHLDEGKAVDEYPGRYSIIGEQGRGGMGRVLRVHDESLHRDVALKELKAGPSSGEVPPELVSRFLREARITGQLEHPGITPVYELGRRPDGTYYYTMKFIRGKSLGEAIRAAKSLEERLELLPHFVDACQAVAYAHSKGVIHRDLKPDNIMIGEFGATAVVDWGLAKVVGQPDSVRTEMAATVQLIRDSAAKTDSGRTQHGQAVGTPAYMPPEQASGLLEKVDARSDIYSLGAVLYQIITGRAPFTGESVYELLQKALSSTPEHPRKVEKKAPKDLSRLCLKAMHKDPDKRIATAELLAKRVEKWRPPVKPGLARQLVGYTVLLGLIVYLPTMWLAGQYYDAQIREQIALMQAKGADLSLEPGRLSDERAALADSMGSDLPYTVQDYLNSIIMLRPNWRLPNALPRGINIPKVKLLESDDAVSALHDQQDLVDALRKAASMPPAAYIGGTELGRVEGDPVLVTHYELLSWAAVHAAMLGDADEALRICTDILRIQEHSWDRVGTAQSMGYGLFVVASTTREIGPYGPFSIDVVGEFKERVRSIHQRRDTVISVDRHFAGLVYQNENPLMPTSPLHRVTDSFSLGTLLNRHDLLAAMRMLNEARDWIVLDAVEARSPMHRQFEAFERLGDPFDSGRIQLGLRGARYRVVWASGITGASQQYRSQLLLAQTETELAVWQYKHLHGAFPESLDALVPGILPELPNDPFSGEPLLYERHEDGFRFLPNPKVPGPVNRFDMMGSTYEWIWRR